MSGYRKRKSSEVIESDRKRFSVDRYGYNPYNQQYNAYQSTNEGHPYKKDESYPYESSSTDFKTEYGTPRHINTKYEEHCAAMMPNYNSSAYFNKAIVTSEYGQYNCHRQSNFSYEYVKKLQFSERRSINFNDLWKYLTDINISCNRNWNFSTAYDLVRELETSLKFYIDTRNEMIFLRKVHCHFCVPFSYNEINISNTAVLYNRINFLENESTYRSHRMNQLYQYLQSIVIPSVVDDIMYSHSLSFKTFWTDRARYWFNKFKRIRSENSVRRGNYNTSSYRNKYQWSHHNHKRHRMSKESDYVSIKSEAVVVSNVPPASDYFEDFKVPKVEPKQISEQRECDQVPKTETKQTAAQLECNTTQIEKSIQQETNTIGKLINNEDNKRGECDHASSIERNSNEQNEEAKGEKGNSDEETVNKDGEETGVLSNSLILIEPQISIITIVDVEDKEGSDKNVDSSEKDN